MILAAWPAGAQDAKTPYPVMAPLEQYLVADRAAPFSEHVAGVGECKGPVSTLTSENTASTSENTVSTGWYMLDVSFTLV